MSGTRPHRQNIRYFGLPRQGVGVLVAMVLVSLLIHLGSVLNLKNLPSVNTTSLNLPNKNTVKIKVTQIPKTEAKKILEAQQTKTAAPDIARYRGANNHKTEKETKVAANRIRPKAADPGDLATSNGPAKSARPAGQPQQKAIGRELKIAPLGTKEIGIVRPKPRNTYESLIPTNNELAGVMRAGYQDYIDEKLEEGDRVDINTSDYRFIGYFTLMRKAIEAVWYYPSDAARRGLQGEVALEFTIFKDGTVRGVKVLQSSGYEILDRAIVEAIKTASPFSPLPADMRKNKLVITGSFRYVLYGSYAGG